MSAPAANARSLPVSTMQPMPSSASKASSARPSSSISGSLKAFSCLGRWSRITPVLRSPVPATSTRMFSNVTPVRAWIMGGLLQLEWRQL